MLCFCLIYYHHCFSKSRDSSLFKFSSGYIGFFMLYLILFSGGNQQSEMGITVSQCLCVPFYSLFHRPPPPSPSLLLLPAAMLHGLLETAWKLFKLFLFLFSLCPILSSSLFLYDITRCNFDSSASLFSTLLHALQIILSLSVVCVHSICC